MFNQTQNPKGATVGNPSTEGNKAKTNFNYQFSVLQVLGQIAAAIPAAACCPTDATEATLLQVLAALQNGQEFEQILVVDEGGAGCPANCPVYTQVRIWDTVTHTFGPPVYYNAAGAVVVPVGPLQFVNPQFVLDNILTQVTAINTALASVSRTPTMLRAAGVGIVTAGKRSVSFYNAGGNNATVLGAPLLPGEQVSFPAGGQGDILTALAYDATGTDLLITTVG